MVNDVEATKFWISNINQAAISRETYEVTLAAASGAYSPKTDVVMLCLIMITP